MAWLSGNLSSSRGVPWRLFLGWLGDTPGGMDTKLVRVLTISKVREVKGEMRHHAELRLLACLVCLDCLFCFSPREEAQNPSRPFRFCLAPAVF